MVVAKVGCCGKVLRLQLTQVPEAASLNALRPAEAAASTHPGLGRHLGELKPQHLSATTHLRNNHMYGGVNMGAFIKYYIGASNIQLTEYNHNL